MIISGVKSFNPIFRRMRQINATMVQCCCSFQPDGLLDPQEPSEHKVYIFCAKKEKKTALTKKRQQQSV